MAEGPAGLQQEAHDVHIIALHNAEASTGPSSACDQEEIRSGRGLPKLETREKDVAVGCAGWRASQHQRKLGFLPEFRASPYDCTFMTIGFVAMDFDIPLLLKITWVSFVKLK